MAMVSMNQLVSIIEKKTVVRERELYRPEYIHLSASPREWTEASPVTKLRQFKRPPVKRFETW